MINQKESTYLVTSPILHLGQIKKILDTVME